MKNVNNIKRVLLFLIILDLTIFVVAYFFPEIWYQIFHGTDYDDPQGLLRRSAASWAAFALIQIVAYLRWQKDITWLAIVAGIRLGEIFAYWSYLCFCENITWFGWVALFTASSLNAVLGWNILKKIRN